MRNSCTCVLIISFSICTFTCALAQQAPILNWSKNYGGSSVDAATAIHQLADGSIVFAGYTSSNDNEVSSNHGGYDFWLVKLDSTGNLLWQKCYGGTGDEKAFDMQLTHSGGFVLTGSTTTNNNGDVTGYHGNTDVWLVVTDANGTLLHEKCFGGSAGESAAGVAQDESGNYLLAASTLSTDGDVSEDPADNQDAWLVKVDSSLTKVWDHCAGSDYYDAGADVFQKKNGTYAFLVSNECCSGSGNLMDVYTLSTAGTTVNYNSYFTGNDFTYPVSLFEKPNGQLLGGGWHSDFEQFDFAAFESDSNGSLVWSHIYDIIDNGEQYNELGGSIGLVSDGTSLLAGYGGSQSNGILVLLNQIGTILFTNYYGGTGYDVFDDMEVGYTDATFIAGNTLSHDGDLDQNYGSNDAWILKLQAQPGAPPPVITTLPLSSTMLCPGNEYDVSFTATGSFYPGNVFTVQLSDMYGAFNFVTVLGTFPGTDSTGTFSVTIPTSINNGNYDLYRIRVIASSPYAAGTDNGTNLTIVCPKPQNPENVSITSTDAILVWDANQCPEDNYKVGVHAIGESYHFFHRTKSFIHLQSLHPSTTYEWKVRSKCSNSLQITYSGWSSLATFTTHPQKIVSLSEKPPIHLSVTPNPFSESAVIGFSTEENSSVHMELCDLHGRRIKSIADSYFDEGHYQLLLLRENLEAGIFLLQIKTNSHTETQKIIIQ